MSINLHSGPEDPCAPRGPNPEYLAFALEMLGHRRAFLTTAVMLRIAAIWRGEGTWEERMIATMQAAEAESPGLWTAITGAPAAQIEWSDFCHRQRMDRAAAEIAACSNERIAAARDKQRAEEHAAYARGNGAFSNQ